jgi:agmatinase
MKNFAGIEDQYAAFDQSAILLQAVPYDGTSTWGKGSDKGPEAFLEAAENMELYDIETGTEVYRKGISMLPPILENASPESMCRAVYERAKELLNSGKFLTFFGGEHSISIGVMRAFYEKYPGISILQLDAHADLRPAYLGSSCNHACALSGASRNANLVQVGIRSMDISEMTFLNPDKCFFAHDIYGQTAWMEKAIDLLGDEVYITLDLDVFDPSVMPATGTPEPGGMDFYTMLKFLKLVFRKKNILGFDIVELAPLAGNKAPEFMVAKLYYKMLSYKFMDDES